MKRADLIRHIEAEGCRLMREGGNHSVYVNPSALTPWVHRHFEKLPSLLKTIKPVISN